MHFQQLKNFFPRMLQFSISFASILYTSACGREAHNSDLSKSLSENPLNRGTADRRVREKGTQGRPADEELEGFRIGSKSQAARYAEVLKKAQQENTDMSLVVLGDSLGAATFGGTSIGQELKPSDLWRVLRAISLQYFLPSTDGVFLEKVKEITGYEKYNAFSGIQDYSHKTRIQKSLGVTLTSVNYAIPGSRTEQLSAQVESLRRDFENSLKAPAYIALSVGGNDFCDNYPVELSIEKLYQSIRKIRAIVPQALILLSGIPDIVTVYLDYDRTAFKVGGLPFTCRQRAQLFPMCARETEIITGDKGAIARAKQDLFRYQEGFAQLVKRIEEDFPNEGPVRYKGLPKLDLNDSLLAADCFHPGIAGHRKIADTTWDEVSDVFQF